MAGPISLKALVHAITSAVSEAQYEVERAQVTNLSRFFDENARPRMMRMRLPSSRPRAAPGEEQVYGVPLLTLAPQSQLRITEAKFSFDVDLGDLSEPEGFDSGGMMDGFEAHTRILSVANAPRLLGGRRKPAKVIIKVEAVEQVEGVARIINELNKIHGEMADLSSSNETAGGTGSRSGGGA